MLILYDIEQGLCESWEQYFHKEIEKGYVEVRNIPFKYVKCVNVVTAGNSYGWMTGGIDLAVRNYYGQTIQDDIQSYILSLPGRFLPVGEHIRVNTRDKDKPHLIYAPTMQIPKRIDTIDVFYVFSKLLKHYETFACCGLGTLTGGLTFDECAKAMHDAYVYVKGNIDEN